MAKITGKRLKYGAISTALTVAFIAIVIIFNIVFSALAGKYGWLIDMTEEKVYSLSDDARAIMSDITEPVNIYFASDPDVLMGGSYSAYTRYVYKTALQLRDEFPNVNVECVDVRKNPAFFRDFYNTTATVIDSSSVIVESSGEVRVFSINAFYTCEDSSDLSTAWEYNGEKRLISGIMQVTQTEKPVVVFTTEHGEDISGAVNLGTIFAENGYEIKVADLTKEDIQDDCRIVVIYDPMYDFIGAEGREKEYNEIEKLDAFLDRYGCLMVFISPDHAGKLDNLNEFLEEWGISYEAGVAVRDTEHALSTDGYTIIPQYLRDTMGGSIYIDLNALDTPPKTVIEKAAPIDILWENGGSLNGTRVVSPVLKSESTSEKVRGGVTEGKGSFNVVTVTRESRIVDNEYYYSYVMAFGSPSFADSAWIESNAFANEDIIAAAMKATGRERVLAALEFKPFDDSDITITPAEANRLTVACTIVIPLILAVAGIVITVRRKNR